MALNDILKYIEANKSRYSLEVLLGELRRNGYPENEIQEALNEFSVPSVPIVSHGEAVSSANEATGRKIGAWIGGLLASFSLFVLAAVVTGFSYVVSAFGGNTDFFFVVAGISGGILLILHIAAFTRLRRYWPNFVRGTMVACIIFGIIAGVVVAYVYLYIVI